MVEFLRICGIALPCYLAFSVLLGIVVGRALKSGGDDTVIATDDQPDAVTPRARVREVAAFADTDGLQPAM